MVDTKGGPDINGLSAWQAALVAQADELRNEVRANQVALAQVEERLALVTKLIEVETRTTRGGSPVPGNKHPGGDSDSSAAPPASSVDLEATAEDILRSAGSPLHISAIREALIARGVALPGRGDEANIIVRLSRHRDRFTRTARGTYGLAEWGTPALARRRTRRRRRAAAR